MPSLCSACSTFLVLMTAAGNRPHYILPKTTQPLTGLVTPTSYIIIVKYRGGFCYNPPPPVDYNDDKKPTMNVKKMENIPGQKPRVYTCVYFFLKKKIT